MSNYSSPTRPAQFRFPEWANLFVEEQAAAAGSTKTEVVLRALECLRERQLEDLMAKGYVARANEGRDFSEVALGAAEDSWPTW
jgi:hypothetical protein